MFWKELSPDFAQTHFIIHYISFFPSRQCLALLMVQVESQNKHDLSYNAHDLTLKKRTFINKLNMIHDTTVSTI